ncbi:MAG: fold metallo-hydrolase [Marmoricola sp.]|nr:fold metallo-hydrolase [Marmoricola sp.]
MRITKFGHACVRIEHDDTVIVLDPGVFTDQEAVAGATAVLITHEHPDHYSPDHLRATDAPVFTIGAVAEKIRTDAPDVAERVTVVRPGDQLEPGVPVRVIGDKHAVIHPELPRFDNSGYLLTVGDQRIYHPGDSLTMPGQEIDLLLLPVSAPWLKISECIDFARDVKAPKSLAIHDMIYSEIGFGIIDGQLKSFLGQREQEYLRLKPGQDV